MSANFKIAIPLAALMILVLYSFQATSDSRINDVESDSVDTISDTITTRNLFIRIHTDILVPGCTVIGCHDGHFEPDFRTLESSYYTMVYQPVHKNNIAGSFEFRVIPYDTSGSVLYERITNCCFVNTDDGMPQLIIGEPLPAEEIAAIGQWIMAGAPDMMGRLPVKPEPVVASTASTEIAREVVSFNLKVLDIALAACFPNYRSPSIE